MEEKDKLIEAARIIQEHCKHTEMGGLCTLAYRGVCDGVNNCRISCVGGPIPGEDWEIQKTCRWTQADDNMAKALVSVGFTFVKHVKNYNGVFAMDGIGLECRIPVGIFRSVKSDETVQLSDIIAEYEKCNWGK